MSKQVSQASIYDPDRIAFRTDLSGNDINIRPRSFLTSADAADVGQALRQIAGELALDLVDDPTSKDGADGELVAPVRKVRGSCQLFALREDVEIDVLRVIRGLRDRGIPAQPNHVYFVTSLPKSFNPNLFAPNLFAPNLFAPNLFAPNLFAPNLFAGGAGQGTSCCCPRGLSNGESRPVPRLAATPVPAPDTPFAAEIAEKDQSVEIHVIDIASPGPDRNPESEVGELTQNGFITNDAVDENHDGWADPATGHGDFVQSIAELHSGMKARLWHAADPLGDIDDAHLVLALQEVDKQASTDKERVLNLSLSGYNEDDRPSVILADQIESMVASGWTIVASAGNNASCRLAWPAALPGVVAVGALDDCGPAWFSNYGEWVDASAHGVNIVAGYPLLTKLESRDVAEKEDGSMLDTHDFDTGWASWSGTSFSAPFVAAKLALRLQDGDSREAAIETVISDPNLLRVPNFGTVVR